MSLNEVSKDEDVEKITQLVFPKENLQEIAGLNLVMEIYMRSFNFNKLEPGVMSSMMFSMLLVVIPFILRVA